MQPLIDLGDLAAPHGSKPWATAVRMKLQSLLKDATSDVEHLRYWYGEIVKYEGWKQLEDSKGRLFKTFESFSTAKRPFGLGYDPKDIDHIIAERKEAKALANAAEPCNLQGRPKKEDKGRQSTISGRASDYRVARIARDRPDVLERMKAGEFKSVRAAAIEAGIVKVPTPLQLLQKTWPKATTKERKAFLRWTQENP